MPSALPIAELRALRQSARRRRSTRRSGIDTMPSRSAKGSNAMADPFELWRLMWSSAISRGLESLADTVPSAAALDRGRHAGSIDLSCLATLKRIRLELPTMLFMERGVQVRAKAPPVLIVAPYAIHEASIADFAGTQPGVSPDRGRVGKRGADLLEVGDPRDARLRHRRLPRRPQRCCRRSWRPRVPGRACVRAAGWPRPMPRAFRARSQGSSSPARRSTPARRNRTSPEPSSRSRPPRCANPRAQRRTGSRIAVPRAVVQ